MRSVFLGDAHLAPPAGPRHWALFEFIEGVEADSLFLMGDLFEVLAYLPALRHGHAGPVIEALERRARGGTHVVYIEGNHDFAVRPILDPVVEVRRGPSEDRLDGLRVHIAHGDEVQRLDAGYALARPLLRSRPAAVAARLVGARALERLGDLAAGASREWRGEADRGWRSEKLRYVRRRAAEGVDLVVLGHSHRLLTEPVAGAQVVQVGCFDEREQYVVLEGPTLELWEGDSLVEQIELATER